MVDKDGRRMCYYCMQGYPKEILKYKPNDSVWRESYPPIPREEYVVFGLDFDTGKIEKYMTTDQIISEVKRLYGDKYKITSEIRPYLGSITNTITKETGPMIEVDCSFEYKVDDNSKRADLRFKLVGSNLNGLEPLEMGHNNMKSPLFIR